jgi:hypothetical protein
VNAPGFSAEASLYRTSGRYYGTSVTFANKGAVLPQSCEYMTFNGELYVCCCDENWSNCQCTGVS